MRMRWGESLRRRDVIRQHEFSAEELRRIELTCSSGDTDSIPKVEDAGTIRRTADGSVQVMHNGVLIEEGCYHGAWMTEVIRRLRGHHEPQEEAVFHAAVERLSQERRFLTMVELGSFWSYYALWMRRAVPDTTCILVEPDPESLEVGKRNFVLNGEEGRFVHGMIGPLDGDVADFVCESDGVARRTPVVTVDGLLLREGLERIDLLLCDAQGAETEMLAGAREAMDQRRIRFLVLSTHHHRISGDPMTHQRCLQGVLDAGATIVAEHSVPESFSGDGLIVASFDARDADFRVEVSRARARDSLFGELEPELAAAQAERDALQARLDDSSGGTERD